VKKNKVRVYVHFVWATWDRNPLIRPEIERQIYRYISDVCADDRCDVLAIGGMEDHVHLMVNLAPTISMAELMKDVKGGSSRFVSEEVCPGEWFQWQGHYGAFSGGARDKAKVIAYIQNQKAHHAAGTLWPDAEEPTEEFTFADDESPVSMEIDTRPVGHPAE